RKHRDFLMDKRAGTSAVHVRIYIPDQELPSDFPSDARRHHSQTYTNGLSYTHDQRRGWYIDHSLHHGTLDDDPWAKGYLPTINTRVMDGVRVAVADEIAATESAITALGFAVPN